MMYVSFLYALHIEYIYSLINSIFINWEIIF